MPNQVRATIRDIDGARYRYYEMDGKKSSARLYTIAELKKEFPSGKVVFFRSGKTARHVTLFTTERRSSAEESRWAMQAKMVEVEVKGKKEYHAFVIAFGHTPPQADPKGEYWIEEIT